MNDHTAATANVSDLTQMVKMLLANGVISTADILSATAEHPQPALPPQLAHLQSGAEHDRLAHLVPGEPILIRDLVAKTRLVMKPSTARAYSTYLNVLVDGIANTNPAKALEGLGDRWAHHITTSDLEVVLTHIHNRAIEHNNQRAAVRRDLGRATRDSNGHAARYNAIGAWRRLFTVAINDRHLLKGYNPAADLTKPPRGNTDRRPLPANEIEEMWMVLGRTGNDPELDLMIAETIVITGARREGLINLMISDLDCVHCTVRLDEKFDKIDRQPVPDWFVAKLLRFAQDRGAHASTDKVFRLRKGPDGDPGTPITSRRLDYAFGRVQATLEWADRKQVTAHTLRHHAIGLIERHAGFQVANKFARHEPDSVSKRYGQATVEEVARAVIEIHGGNNPLAPDHLG